MSNDKATLKEIVTDVKSIIKEDAFTFKNNFNSRTIIGITWILFACWAIPKWEVYVAIRWGINSGFAEIPYRLLSLIIALYILEPLRSNIKSTLIKYGYGIIILSIFFIANTIADELQQRFHLSNDVNLLLFACIYFLIDWLFTKITGKSLMFQPHANEEIKEADK